MTEKTIRLGTRSSPLALKQADMVKQALENVHTNINVQIVPIKSAADWKKQEGDKPLQALEGGKGLFAKEIEQQLLDRKVDIGVHSTKDMPSILPEGLVIDHYLPREDARDVLIAQDCKSIEDLPKGAVVGTCSPRRAAIALEKRPDLKIVPFRGNIQTRLDKIKSGQADATFLAMAGLKRLGINDPIITPISVEDMLPAAGQGAICIETRIEDQTVQRFPEAISCTRTQLCVSAERAVLKTLDGSCDTPIAAYAVFEKNQMILRAMIGEAKNKNHYARAETEIKNVDDAETFGTELAKELHALVDAV